MDTLPILLFILTSVKFSHTSKTCYVHLGCLETNNSWFSPNRPFNPPTNSRESINTTFQMYTMATKRDGDAVFVDYETFDTKNYFKNAERNFFIIHGFLSWGRADWILEIKDELLNIYREKANVFSVDWSGHTVDYAQTAANARVVGLEVAKFINTILINNNSVSSSTVHIIGHSLGAHAAGYVGERVPGMLRITGLDPAGQHFAGMPPYVRLDPTDAQFVDVIHTDTHGYGTNRPMGHVDFYANGEGEQPGCGALNLVPQFLNQGMNATLQETGTCSHSRAHHYFIETLQSFNKTSNTICKFVAYRCMNYQEMIEGKCINNCNPNSGDKCMFVGLSARLIKNSRNVIMYFKTGNYKPYCLTPYRTYIDVITTSLPVMYTVVYLTVYDAKGAATSWSFNDGQPMAVQSRMILSTLVFSTAVLASSEVHMVNLHWNSRFYPFGLLRKALVNGFIRVRHIKVTTIDGKRLKLCPRGGESGVDVFEYDEVMFYVDKCNDYKIVSKNNSNNASVNANSSANAVGNAGSSSSASSSSSSSTA